MSDDRYGLPDDPDAGAALLAFEAPRSPHGPAAPEAGPGVGVGLPAPAAPRAGGAARAGRVLRHRDRGEPLGAAPGLRDREPAGGLPAAGATSTTRGSPRAHSAPSVSGRAQRSTGMAQARPASTGPRSPGDTRIRPVASRRCATMSRSIPGRVDGCWLDDERVRPAARGLLRRLDHRRDPGAVQGRAGDGALVARAGRVSRRRDDPS